MPVKLIGTIILLIAVTVFAGSNLDNKCDINLVFYKFEQVPVFMTVIASFAIGAILMLPFTFGRRHKKDQKPAENKTEKSKSESKSSEESESKTLFDFKIKKDLPKSDKSKEKKSLSDKNKKEETSSDATATDSSAPQADFSKLS